MVTNQEAGYFGSTRSRILPDRHDAVDNRRIVVMLKAVEKLEFYDIIIIILLRHLGSNFHIGAANNEQIIS